MLKARVLSALVIAPIFLLTIVFANQFVFALLWALILALAAREWAAFAQYFGWSQIAFTAICALLTLFLINCYPYFDPLLLLVICASVAVIWLVLVPLWLWQFHLTQKLPLNNSVLLALGMAFLLGFAIAVSVLREIAGAYALIGLLVVIWAADIGAYFTGRYFGKHALAPNISPKKTIEGLLGGLALAALVIVLLLLFDFNVPAWLYVVVSLVIVVYATVGDLFESVLKRRIDIKDSGQLIPGHGGVMDRIDSWLPSMVLWAVLFLAFSF